jgi:adhesin transport system outer membrane protein
VRLSVLAALCCCAPIDLSALTLDEAIQVTLEANPEIGEAVSNREAIEFELKQARRLYLPQIDLEGRYGAQKFDSPATRPRGDDNKAFQRREGSVIVQQLLFNGFDRIGEVQRQASRVDGASFRVYERSEFIALNVAREYLEVGLQQEIVGYAEENLAYHRKVLGNIAKGTEAQAISEADHQQAQERVYSAESRLIQAQEDENSAKIRFFKLVGQPLEGYLTPISVTSSLPPSLNEAIGVARQHSPTIDVATADLDTAYAQLKQSKSDYYPELAVELRGRSGDDLDGIEGHENELRAELVMRWNIFRGGIDLANQQEQLRRVDEERFGLNRAHRDVEEAVRLSWDRRQKQQERVVSLRNQLASNKKLVTSYTEQFDVGERSLLDLLNTQNSLFNTQIGLATARNALVFAEYRILASVGVLLQVLQVPPPSQSGAYARSWVRAPYTPEAETQPRYSPFPQLGQE